MLQLGQLFLELRVWQDLMADTSAVFLRGPQDLIADRGTFILCGPQDLRLTLWSLSMLAIISLLLPDFAYCSSTAATPPFPGSGGSAPHSPEPRHAAVLPDSPASSLVAGPLPAATVLPQLALLEVLGAVVLPLGSSVAPSWPAAGVLLSYFAPCSFSLRVHSCTNICCTSLLSETP